MRLHDIAGNEIDLVMQRNDAGLDLADEAEWEEHVQCQELEFEEDHSQPVFGLRRNSGNICEYVEWWCDGDPSNYLN